MKLLLLFAFCCSIYLPTLAQNDSLNQLFLKDKTGQTHLSPSPDRVTIKEKLPPSFSHFEVVDFRPDTTRAGFWAVDKIRYEFVFDKPASQVMSSFFNHYAHANGTRSFLIIIKKLWLCDMEDAPKVANGPRDKGRIEFRGEAFLKTNNGYLPFTYLDTLITAPSAIKEMVRFRLSDLFFNFIKKIAAVNEEAVLKRNTFSFNQLDSLNRKRFEYAMDTARVLRKGVYANVEEFRNNQPSIFNYEIQSDGTGMQQLYMKDETGKTYFSRKMWGFCDGKQCYAMMDGNLCPIFSVNHAFYVMGSKENQARTKSTTMTSALLSYAAFGTFVSDKKSNNKIHFFSIDPYSGKNILRS